jgi:membrane-associated phospholipid phosphatase
MTAEDYRRWSSPFRGARQGKALGLANKGLTLLCYASYPFCLLLLCLQKDDRLWPCLVVPGVSFGVVTLYRHLRNAPRPYEVLDIVPLLSKETRGHSFPSRHVFSVFILAMTYLWLCPPAGVVFLVIGVLLALCRVVLGVHFPRDALAGAFIGVLSGILGYWYIFS